MKNFKKAMFISHNQSKIYRKVGDFVPNSGDFMPYSNKTFLSQKVRYFEKAQNHPILRYFFFAIS